MKIERPFKETYDFDHLMKSLNDETRGGAISLMELTVDAEIMVEATGGDFPAEQFRKVMDIALGPNELTEEQLTLGIQYMDLLADFSHAVGYDYISAYPVIPIELTRMMSVENPQQDNKLRSWQEEHKGIITSREDFETFQWPGEGEINFLSLDYTAEKLAQGQKLLVFQLGIFEYIVKLMGLETMAIASKDDPRLVDDIAENVARLCEYAVDKAAAHPAVGAIFYADDMGHNTGPFLSPGFMREIVFSRMKRIADACHKHKKPFLLHSCGNIELLMEDLIEVGIDARHSFQDNAYPVDPFYKKYRDRIGIAGGVDVDLLASATPEAVRLRTKEILDACGPGGRYAMGSGNSVTNYCKIENYYAMIDETRQWNERNT
ncbi:MAG: hypothetical protein GY866_19285 [Proteobacteria bacterium]|nr:hypothetical protein [Pseudomonadota bacterium]